MCFKKKTKTIEENKKPRPYEGLDNNIAIKPSRNGAPNVNKFVSSSWKSIDNK